MKKDYIDDINELTTFLEQMQDTNEISYDVLWFILTYGLSIQEIVALKRGNLNSHWQCFSHKKGGYVEPCNDIFLLYPPHCFRDNLTPDSLVIYSRKTKKYKAGSRGAVLTRSYCSSLLNTTLRSYREDFNSDSLRKTHIYFYLKTHHTLVLSGCEYLQFRHKKIQTLLDLSEDEYLNLFSGEEQLHTSLKDLEYQFHDRLVKIQKLYNLGEIDSFSYFIDLVQKYGILLDSELEKHF